MECIRCYLGLLEIIFPINEVDPKSNIKCRFRKVLAAMYLFDYFSDTNIHLFGIGTYIIIPILSGKKECLKYVQRSLLQRRLHNIFLLTQHVTNMCSYPCRRKRDGRRIMPLKNCDKPDEHLFFYDAT